MHALAQLIEDTKAANGWSNGYIADHSGGRVTRNRVQQLIHEVKRLPTLRVIEGLSHALGVPAWVVVDAALESMGYPHRSSRVGVEEAIAADPNLSAEQKRALRGFLRHLSDGDAPVREVISRHRPS